MRSQICGVNKISKVRLCVCVFQNFKSLGEPFFFFFWYWWQLYILTYISTGMFLDPVVSSTVAEISKIIWLVGAYLVVKTQKHEGRTIIIIIERTLFISNSWIRVDVICCFPNYPCSPLPGKWKWVDPVYIPAGLSMGLNLQNSKW